MRTEQVFKSRWLNVVDLKGQDVTVTIRSCDFEEVGMEREERAILSFKNRVKRLILNRTNWDTLVQAFGDESDHWIGAEIVLYAGEARYNGKLMPALRIRDTPAAKTANSASAPPKAPDAPINDSILF